MKKLSFKYSGDDFDVTSNIVAKEHPNEDDLDLMVQCFRTLLRKLDYTEKQIDEVLSVN